MGNVTGKATSPIFPQLVTQHIKTTYNDIYIKVFCFFFCILVMAESSQCQQAVTRFPYNCTMDNSEGLGVLEEIPRIRVFIA